MSQEQRRMAVLSAIVVHAVWGLIDLAAMRRYRRSRRIDLVSAVVAVVGVLVAEPRVNANVRVPADVEVRVTLVPPVGADVGLRKVSSSRIVKGPALAVVAATALVGAVR